MTMRCGIVKIGCSCIAGVADNAERVTAMQRGEAINGAGIGMIATGERLGGLGRGACWFHSWCDPQNGIVLPPNANWVSRPHGLAYRSEGRRIRRCPARPAHKDTAMHRAKPRLALSQTGTPIPSPLEGENKPIGVLSECQSASGMDQGALMQQK